MSNYRKLIFRLVLLAVLSCYIFSAATAEQPPAVAPASDNEPQSDCHTDSDGSTKCGGPPGHGNDDDDDDDDDDNDDDDDDSCWWAIVLGVVGGVALIVIAIVAFILIRKRKAIHSTSPEVAETKTKTDQKSEQTDDASKSDPPPSYQTAQKDPAKVHDVTGQAEMPPPYTVQLPPYNPAQNVYIYMDKMTAPAATASHE